MKCLDQRDAILVMSFGPFLHTEAAAAFSDQSWHGFSSFSGTVTYYDFDVPRDLLVVLDLFDRISLGFFYSSYVDTYMVACSPSRRRTASSTFSGSSFRPPRLVSLQQR